MLLSARHEKSAEIGVGMNGYAILFHKTCVHPATLFVYTMHCTTGDYWNNVFGIGMGGVRMRSKITPFSRFYFPADFSWRAVQIVGPERPNTVIMGSNCIRGTDE
jgi:hypothetical protein